MGAKKDLTRNERLTLTVSLLSLALSVPVSLLALYLQFFYTGSGLRMLPIELTIGQTGTFSEFKMSLAVFNTGTEDAMLLMAFPRAWEKSDRSGAEGMYSIGQLNADKLPLLFAPKRMQIIELSGRYETAALFEFAAPPRPPETEALVPIGVQFEAMSANGQKYMGDVLAFDAYVSTERVTRWTGPTIDQVDLLGSRYKTSR